VSLEDGEVEGEVIIIPAYLAKGLEFDAVIVYNVSKENYTREIDRRLLYIACTRALHSLTLLYEKEPSKFIPPSTF
jgi:DNA helicase-2/ATP-dependent DNA helicase PcrA